MLQLQRDVEIQQALDVIAAQATEVGHHLQHALDFGALKSEAAGHDHADVARSQDDETAAGHVTFDIDPTLRRPRGEDARRTRAGDADLRAGALAAAHREHNCLRAELLEARACSRRVHPAVRRHLQHDGIEQILDADSLRLVDKPLSVAGTGQVFLERLHAKAVVDALKQDPAEFQVAINQQHIVRAVLFGLDSGGQSPRPRADDDDIVVGFECVGHNVYLS